MSKFDLKPFDKVLVRDRDDDGNVWKIELFERKDKDAKRYPYICMHCAYTECIPYNEETEHLLGTNEPYIPVEDEATKYTPGEIVEIWDSENGWTDAIYLGFLKTKYFKGNVHKVYSKKHEICCQPPNEIRKRRFRK